MKIGIIGAPQSGKTTIFRILLHKNISGSIGIFKVSDSRIDKISGLVSAKKTTYPEFTFVDMAQVTEVTKLDLQDTDLFICAIGAFLSDNPEKDFEKITTDVIITDLEVIQNRIDRIEKEGKRQDAERELKILERFQAVLSDGRFLSSVRLDSDDQKWLSGLAFLSLKPFIAAINIPDELSEDTNNKIKKFEEKCGENGITYIRFYGKTELELMELEDAEREKFLKEIGPGYNFREDISKLITKELNLITFLTAGEKDTRGWFLKSGLNILEAAGKIHSDIKRGFIRAEVVSYDDFIKYGSANKAREAGLQKIEGKEYIVRDGDVINVRFNV